MFFRILRFLIVPIICLCCFRPISGWSQTSGPLSYENETMGIKLTGPEGWYITPGEKAKTAVSKSIGDITSLESIKEATKKLGILVVFSQYPFGSPKEFNPNITLTTEQIPPEYSTVYKTAIDIANGNILSVKAMFKDAAIIKEPITITVDSKEGAHFIYEGTAVRGYSEIRIRCSAYIFIKDNITYTLSFTDKADNFKNNIKAFESSVNTFVFK